MTASIRVLLVTICLTALGLVGVACGGDDDESTAGTSTYPTAAAATSAPAATSTVAAAVATATTAPAAAAPTTAPPPSAANTPVPPPAAAPTTAPAPAPPAAAALSVTIADFSFSPATLTARAGQAVTFNVRNGGAATHTFSIQNGPTSGNIAGGASATVQFTAPAQPGGVRFFCMIHGSMQGTVTITN